MSSISQTKGFLGSLGMALFAFGTIFVTACGSSNANKAPENANNLQPNKGERKESDVQLSDKQVLSGQHSGRSWKFAAGNATKGPDGQLALAFFDTQQADACSFGALGASRTLLTLVPNKVGTYRNKENATEGIAPRTITFSEVFASFSKPPTNVITDVFAIRIDSISEKEIKGTLTGRFDDKNAASGTFTITNCAVGDANNNPIPEPEPVLEPEPTPTPTTQPTLNTIPTELNGTWEEVQSESGFNIVSRFTIGEGGLARLQIIVGEETLIDFDLAASLPTDANAQKTGLDFKVTKVNVDTSEVPSKIGDTLLCLYSLDTAKNPNEFKLDCGEAGSTTRPSTFGEDVMNLVRK